MLSHIGNDGMSILPWLDFSGYGNFGVLCFFFVSGLVLTMTYERRFADGIGLHGFGEYYVRRLFRIFPLLWAVLIITYLLRLHYFTTYDPVNLLGLLFLWQSPPSVLWTLPIELQYYLALPLLIFLFHNARRVLTYLFPAAIAVYLVACYLNRQDEHYILATLGIHRYTLVFVVGTLTGLYFDRLRALVSSRLSGRTNALIVLAVLVVFLLMNPVYFDAAYEAVYRLRGHTKDYVYEATSYYNNRYLIVGLLLAVFIVSASDAAGGVRRVLTSAPVIFVGRISYSMYLLHMPVLDVVNLTSLPAPAKGVAVLVLTVLLSALTYRAIERPFMHFGRIVSARAAV